MGIFLEIRLGNALTQLTNMYEEIEATRSTHFVGAGGGFDSLPLRRQAELESRIPKWLKLIEQVPRHKVTFALVKNAQISERNGRQERFRAQEKLLDWLIEQNLAMDIETFLKSYGNGA